MPAQAGAAQAAGKISNASVTLLGEGSTTTISIVTVCLLFALWWLATQLRWLPPLVLPSPEAVWKAFMASNRGELQGGTTLLEHFGWSFARVFGAFFLAVVTAVPIGILMGVSRVARGVFDPPIEFYRPLPPLAYLPLVIIWFGIEETSKVVLIYLACFAPLAVSARAGVKSATIEQINAVALDGRVVPAGGPPCDPAGGAAGHPHRHAHRHRLRLDHAGGGGNGRRHRRVSARWC